MVDGIKVDARPFDILNERVEEMIGSLGDLRPLFELFSSDFYKDEKKIFSLKSRGKYEELNSKYKVRKQKYYGFAYPILFAHGRLAASLLSRRGRDSVNIIKKTEFVIGTAVPYAKYHHSEKPRKKIPRRPVYFFGDKNQELTKRWVRTTDAYLGKITKDILNGN